MKLSIIIAVMNDFYSLLHTLQELAAQNSRDFEVIIQDGGSKDFDASALDNFAKEYGLAISYKSEPDCGVYDAWNKALKRITGEWVLFIGAWDKLTDLSALTEENTI